MSSPFDPPETRSADPSDFAVQVREQVAGAKPYQLIVAVVVALGAGLVMLASIFNPCMAVMAMLTFWPLWLLFDATRNLNAASVEEQVAMSIAKQAQFWRITGWLTLVFVGLQVIMFVLLFAVVGVQ